MPNTMAIKLTNAEWLREVPGQDAMTSTSSTSTDHISM